MGMPVKFEQGDIVLVDFNPQAGHEQMGRRPALVVSNTQYHKYTNLLLVCPITNTDRPFPLHVHLDDNSKTTGVVMCEQLRSLDPEARNAVKIEKAPPDILREALERVGMCVK